MAFSLMARGSFTSAGVGVKVDLPGSCDLFLAKNLTQQALSGTTSVEWEWNPTIASAVAGGTGIETYKAGTNAVLKRVPVTGGFVYRVTQPAPEAAVVGTTITQNATPVCTAATHGYSTGDRVRIYASTGMLQIAGMDFTITRTGANTFTLDGIDTSGFAAGATAFVVRRLPALQEVEPGALFLTAISNAASAVARTSVAHSFQVGQLVNFVVPSDFGMVEMSGKTGKVTAVTATTFTVDIDSTGFTAFAFPASASVPNTRFAMVSSAGQRNTYDVTNVPFHTGQFYPYMYLNAGANNPAGQANDVIEWEAWKAEV